MEPMKDIVFKSIFKLDKEHIIIKTLAKELLGVELESFKVEHPGFIAKGKNKKGEIADYYCEINGQKITIECNRKLDSALFARNINHLRRMVVDYGFDICQINFDGYDILGENKLVYEFKMQEVEGSSNLYSNLLKIYHINLKYLENIIERDYNNLEKYSLFERIGMVFMTKNKKELEKVVKNNIDLKKIEQIIEEINNDNSLLDQYTKHELEIIIEAKEKLEEGRKKGIKEGEMLGIEKEKLAIAKNMLKLGLDKDIIMQSTGIDEYELDKITDQN